MTDKVKEIRVETKIKNNRLHRAIMSKFKAVSRFASHAAINAQTVYGLLSFKYSPYDSKKGFPTKYAIKIADELRLSVSFLFPVELYRHLLVPEIKNKFKNSATFELHLEQAKRIGLSTLVVEHENELNQNSLIQWDMRKAIDQSISILNPREKLVLKLRFGFDNNDPMTLWEVGHILKVTQERVRQIESKALRKLRHPNRTKKLRTLGNFDHFDNVECHHCKEYFETTVPDRKICRPCRLNPNA